MTAPACDWQIVFDGGSLGNPGRGYGSYRLRSRDGEWATAKRLEFGDGVTNNEAEYLSLISGLEELLASVENAASVRVEVVGDSRLVIEQMAGRWKIKAANLRPLVAKAQRLARAFGGVAYQWHGRSNSVKLLGH